MFWQIGGLLSFLFRRNVSGANLLAAIRKAIWTNRLVLKATSEARCLIVCVWFFTSVEPIIPGPSRRDRLLAAVAQWQLRLCFCSPNVTSLCICKSFGYFSPSLFLRNNSKFLGFFSSFRNFTTWVISNRLKIGTNWRKRLSSLRSWKLHHFTIIGCWENGEWKSEHFWVFCKKNFKCRFCSILLLERHRTGSLLVPTDARGCLL